MTNLITGPQLLEAVADHIEAHPDRYDQTSWAYVPDSPSVATVDILLKMGFNDCNTRGCVAGWAVALNVQSQEVRDACSRGTIDIAHMARWLLGLEPHAADILFGEMWEPGPGLSVPEALRLLAKGADIRDVTWERDDDD